MKLSWADEKEARKAKHDALIHLRDTMGYNWKHIARAMNSTRGKCESAYYKALRRRRVALRKSLSKISNPKS